MSNATRRELCLVAVLTVLALALRLALVLIVQRDESAFNDTYFYLLTAQSLAEGGGFAVVPGVPTAYWPPAFPLMLSFLFRATGPHQVAGEILNAVWGALTVPMLYGVARTAFGRREALVAAAILAVLPGQILWTDVLIAETFYTFLLVGFFLLLAVLPLRLESALALGAAIGVITLTGGESLLLILVVLVGWWPSVPRMAILTRAAVLVGMVVLMMAPWTIRNAIVMDAFIPLSTNSSTTLWSGHNPNATGGELTEPKTGKNAEVQEANILRTEALEFMLANPRRELELIPLKLFKLNRGDSWALEWINFGNRGPRPIGEQMAAPIRVLTDFAYYGLLAAAAGSLLLFWRELWRGPVTRGILTLFAGSLFLYGFVYYGNYLFRVPLEPLMIMIATPLLVRAWDLRREARLPSPAS